MTVQLGDVIFLIGKVSLFFILCLLKNRNATCKNSNNSCSRLNLTNYENICYMLVAAGNI